MDSISGSAERGQLGPSRVRATALQGSKYPGSSPRTPVVGAWLAHDGPLHLLLPPTLRCCRGGRRRWTGPLHVNHVPAAGVLGVDPGYLGPIRDDARARDGHSSAHFALSLMRPIIIASISPSTVAMQ